MHWRFCRKLWIRFAARPELILKEISKILLYIAVVVGGGAFLAPPLFWLGQWAIATDVIPQLRPFGFPKYFNRAVLILALALLWPMLRWLGLKGWTDLQLRGNPDRWRDLGLGVLLGAGGLACVGLGLWQMGALTVHHRPRGLDLASALLTGTTVASVEEIFFRGALFGVLRRNLSWPKALAFLSVFFAVLHFVRPDPGAPPISDVSWFAGIRLIPRLFWQFAHLDMVLGSWLTLLLVGWTLGYTVVKTASLYFAIGMHAGWVFALKLLMQVARRQDAASLWIGHDMRSGLAPALLLLLTLLIVTLFLRRRPTNV